VRHCRAGRDWSRYCPRTPDRRADVGDAGAPGSRREPGGPPGGGSPRHRTARAGRPADVETAHAGSQRAVPGVLQRRDLQLPRASPHPRTRRSGVQHLWRHRGAPAVARPLGGRRAGRAERPVRTGLLGLLEQHGRARPRQVRNRPPLFCQDPSRAHRVRLRGQGNTGRRPSRLSCRCRTS
jgi:hypothetical protein